MTVSDTTTRAKAAATVALAARTAWFAAFSATYSSSTGYTALSGDDDGANDGNGLATSPAIVTGKASPSSAPQLKQGSSGGFFPGWRRDVLGCVRFWPHQATKEGTDDGVR